MTNRASKRVTNGRDVYVSFGGRWEHYRTDASGLEMFQGYVDGTVPEAWLALEGNRIASCVHNAWIDGQRGTHCASPEDKVAARKLETLGMVEIERTGVRCAGFQEWWVRFTPEAAAHYASRYPRG